MFTVNEYIESLKTNLEKHSDVLVQNIQKVTQLPFYKGIELLDFSVFFQPFDLSIMLFSMDRTANEVFYEGNDPSIFSGSYELLGDIEYYSLPVAKSDEFWEFYEQHDQELATAEAQLIIDWFLSCWKKANGSNLTLPAYFGFHDDTRTLDLQLNKWIDDEEKWVY